MKERILTVLVTANIIIAVFFLFGEGDAIAKKKRSKSQYVGHVYPTEYCANKGFSPTLSLEIYKNHNETLKKGKEKLISMTCWNQCDCWGVFEKQ